MVGRRFSFGMASWQVRTVSFREGNLPVGCTSLRIRGSSTLQIFLVGRGRCYERCSLFGTNGVEATESSQANEVHPRKVGKNWYTTYVYIYISQLCSWIYCPMFWWLRFSNLQNHSSLFSPMWSWSKTKTRRYKYSKRLMQRKPSQIRILWWICSQPSLGTLQKPWCKLWGKEPLGTLGHYWLQTGSACWMMFGYIAFGMLILQGFSLLNTLTISQLKVSAETVHKSIWSFPGIENIYCIQTDVAGKCFDILAVASPCVTPLLDHCRMYRATGPSKTSSKPLCRLANPHGKMKKEHATMSVSLGTQLANKNHHWESDKLHENMM